MDIKKYIESGILELYVLGLASEQESREVEMLAKEHQVVRDEISELNEAIEELAKKHRKKPHETVKPMVLAIIDYMNRLKQGEPMSMPPELGPTSTVNDYAFWLNNKDAVLPAETDNIYARIIGSTPQLTTAIVWIKQMAPQEVHDNEYERFLIVEGECDIYVDEKPFHLIPGNYFSIPLHSKHYVKVTSTQPCKVILQRVAA